MCFFAFGRADTDRSGTQSAADSAALAAAQKSRDALLGGVVENLFDGDYLEDLFDGKPPGTADGCNEAKRFAKLNDSGTLECKRLADGRWGFTVEVEADKPMGKSIIPGTENKKAKAGATAIVEPRCSFEQDEDAPPSDKPDDPDKDKPGDDDDDDKDKPVPGTFECDGKETEVDPDDPNLMAELFRVRLDAA